MSSAVSDRLALKGSFGDEPGSDEPGSSSGIDELTKNSPVVEGTELSDVCPGNRGSSPKAG